MSKEIILAIKNTWNWSTILPLITSVLGGIIAWLVFRHSKKTQAVQLYLGFLSEYKSKEMLAAIQGLYKFKEECEERGIDCWKNEYKIREGRLLEKLKGIKDEKAFCTLENSLNHQRRTVSHFYHAIYVAAKHRTIPRRRIFRFWPSGGKGGVLAIINKIGVDGGKGLDKLYEMGEKHKERNESWGWFLRPWYWLLDRLT